MDVGTVELTNYAHLGMNDLVLGVDALALQQQLAAQQQQMAQMQAAAVAQAANPSAIPVVGLPGNSFGPSCTLAPYSCFSPQGVLISAPMVMVSGPQGMRQTGLSQSNYGISMGAIVDPYAPAQPNLPSTKGQIFGRIEVIRSY